MSERSYHGATSHSLAASEVKSYFGTCFRYVEIENVSKEDTIIAGAAKNQTESHDWNLSGGTKSRNVSQGVDM